jgi:hypothetical protein
LKNPITEKDLWSGSRCRPSVQTPVPQIIIIIIIIIIVIYVSKTLKILSLSLSPFLCLFYFRPSLYIFSCFCDIKPGKEVA